MLSEVMLPAGRATAKCHCGKEIRRVADSAERRGRVDANSKCRLAQAELAHHGVVLRVEAEACDRVRRN